MISERVKRWGLKAISMGLKAPENPLDRFVEFTMLRRLLTSLRIQLVLDVGANCGQFAQNLRAVGFRGKIVSFEPLNEEFMRLSDTLAGDSNWSGYNFALGGKTEMLEIRIPRISTMSSFLEPANISTLCTRQVDVRRLDELAPTLFAGFRPNVFLKMDTQAYEDKILEGAEGCINDIAGLVSEISVKQSYRGQPYYLDMLGRFEKAGFDLYHISTVGRTKSGCILELNAYMRRRDP